MAVLLTSTYGADISEFRFNTKLIEMVLKRVNNDDIWGYIETKYGKQRRCNLHVEWVDVGNHFAIDSDPDDGEYLLVEEDIEWIEA